MSRKFVRNVTGTKLKGKKIEPFDTNVQNDLLSDETDVYVRQERSKDIDDKYHCLTDDVKEIISNSDLITTENYEHGKSGQEDKNKSYINVNKSNKTESEKMESNSHVMTPLQTGYAIEKNNRDVIPGLVKQHETPTEIVSKSDELKVKKVSKNNFELELETNNDIDLSDYATIEALNTHKNSKNNPHGVTKSQVGLSKVFNKYPSEFGSLILFRNDGDIRYILYDAMWTSKTFKLINDGNPLNKILIESNTSDVDIMKIDIDIIVSNNSGNIPVPMPVFYRNDFNNILNFKGVSSTHTFPLPSSVDDYIISIKTASGYCYITVEELTRL